MGKKVAVKIFLKLRNPLSNAYVNKLKVAKS